MSEVENEDYKEKDIVWTKVKGNQWWPSLITQVSIKQITTLGKTTKEKIYTIELIGEKSSAKVTSEKIESFIKNFDKHANTNNPSLVKSIELAKKIFDKKNKKDEEQNKKEKDNINNRNDNNPKFLQKKRMNDRVILDDEQNEVEKDINIKPPGVENIDLLSASSSGGGVKINININLTNNNQRTYHLNSFQSPEVINPSGSNTNNFILKSNTKPSIPKFNSINYSNISANEKTGNKNSNKKDKNLNNTNKVNNSNKISAKDEEEKSAKSSKKEKKNEEKDYELKLGDKSINKKSMEETNEENENSECDEENEELILTNDIINESIQKILNCQIQISNLSSQKTINKELNNLSEIFNEYCSKNQNDNNNVEIYYLSKDLIPILLNLTQYNKNPDIISKSSEILSFLNEKIIIEVFNLSQKEQTDLIESINNKTINDINKDISKENNINNSNTINLEEEIFKEGKDILELINKKATIKSGISDIHTINSKRGRPKKNSTNSELSSEVFSSKINDGAFNLNNGINEKNYYEEFAKILNIKDKTKLEFEFKELSGDFFDNTYDKNNSDLDIDIAKIRKSVCIKIYKILRKARPDIDIALLKKIIIFFEYKIRFSNTEKIYSCKIKELFEYLKEKLSKNDKVK